MFIHIARFQVQQGRMEEVRSLYNEAFLPSLKEHKGSRFAIMLECRENKGEAVSLTAWERKECCEKFQKEPHYKDFSFRLGDYLRGASEEKSYNVVSSTDLTELGSLFSFLVEPVL